MFMIKCIIFFIMTALVDTDIDMGMEMETRIGGRLLGYQSFG